MAADRIIVSTEEMQQCINAYEAARDTVQQAFQSLTSARESLDNCWEGLAKARYVARWLAIHANLVQTDRVIERAIEGLRNTINIQENTESDVQGRANALDTGVAPPAIFG